MNCTIKEAAYYVSCEKLKQYLNAFLNICNFAKQLKTLNGLTSYKFIQNCWTNQPERFKLKPNHFKYETLQLTIFNLLVKK